jgi:hypothetical protein
VGALAAKLLEIFWSLIDRNRARRLRIKRHVSAALLHLRGVREAPAGESPQYLGERHHLGVELGQLIEVAGENPDAFAEELRVATEVHGAVVIRGERFVDGYIEELASLQGRR